MPIFQSTLQVMISGRIVTNLEIQDPKTLDGKVFLEFMIESFEYYEGPDFGDGSDRVCMEGRSVHLFRVYGAEARRVKKRFRKGDCVQASGTPRVSKGEGNRVRMWHFLYRMSPLPAVPKGSLVPNFQRMWGTMHLGNNPELADLGDSKVVNLDMVATSFVRNDESSRDPSDSPDLRKPESSSKWDTQEEIFVFRALDEMAEQVCNVFSQGDFVMVEGNLQQDVMERGNSSLILNWVFLTSINPISVPKKRV